MRTTITHRCAISTDSFARRRAAGTVSSLNCVSLLAEVAVVGQTFGDALHGALRIAIATYEERSLWLSSYQEVRALEASISTTLKSAAEDAATYAVGSGVGGTTEGAVVLTVPFLAGSAVELWITRVCHISPARQACVRAPCHAPPAGPFHRGPCQARHRASRVPRCALPAPPAVALDRDHVCMQHHKNARISTR